MKEETIDIPDLVQHLSRKGYIKRHRGVRNGNIQLTCPRPHYQNGQRYYEDVPSLGISVESPYLFNCFGCSFRGTVEFFLAETLDMTVEEARKWLEFRYKFDEDFWRKTDDGYQFKEYEELFKKENFVKTFGEEYFAPFRKIHQYTFDRGFEKETAVKYDIGYDENQRRIVMPIRTGEGEIAGLVGRTIDRDEDVKYLLYNYEDGEVVGFNKDWVLYEDKSDYEHDSILVVESALDVAWADQHGLTEIVNVGSILGCKPSDRQADKLAKYDEVIDGLDDDYSGRAGGKLLKRKLKGRVKLSEIEYPEGCKDLGDCDKEQMRRIVENRQSALKKKIKDLKMLE